MLQILPSIFSQEATSIRAANESPTAIDPLTASANALSNFDLSTFLETYAISWGMNIGFAILIYVIGKIVVKVLVSVFVKVMSKSKYDDMLVDFLKSMVHAMLMLFVIIASLNQLGVNTTSLVAILGAAGLAIGLALQGSLSNFAGGVLILIFKPFKVGDLIQGGGHLGVVKEIQIFNTILTTADNRRVIIPNGVLSNNSLINVNVEPTRRVDFVFGIGYGDDIKKTKEILQRIADNDSRVLKDPAPTIVLSELADSSVNFTVRLWVNTADYWGVYFDTHEAVKVTFDAEGISIPFPQQDVHMHQVA